MSWENDMVQMMRGSASQGPSLKLAVMTGPSSCRIGNLELTAADLLISDRLLQPACTKVAGTCPGGGGALTDRSSYLTALKAGDVVLVYQLSDDRFAVIERMVKV